MSRMHEEIIKSMSGLEPLDQEGVKAQFIFQEDFIGFQGHFKNSPILPGVCKIQAVIAMMEKFHQKKFQLNEVSVAKYFRPVTARETILIESHFTFDENKGVRVKALVKKAEDKAALLQLILQEI